MGVLLFSGKISKEQAIRVLKNSLHGIIAVANERIIAMGRLIGDGLYILLQI